MKFSGDVLLDSKKVRFPFVFGQEAGYRLGVAHDGAGNEAPLLAQQEARREQHPQAREKPRGKVSRRVSARHAGARAQRKHYRASRKLIRSSFSWSVSFMSNRRS